MTTTNSIVSAVVAGAALLAFAPLAAQATTRHCVRDGARVFAECKAACTEEFQADKDACTNRDHDCVELCRATRSECREASGVDAALAQCQVSLDAARALCRANTLPDTPERDACIDQAQVVAFQCRDAAREVAKPALVACRKGFQACARACGPADPRPDVAGCRLAAKDEFLACGAICVEDWQVAKDACRTRDHTCVEQCRDDRAACKAPIVVQFAAALSACKTTRDGAVAACRASFADGTPELDQCIDDAQLAAFRCRDDAREAARPQFESCRQAFNVCARGCPAPPTP